MEVFGENSPIARKEHTCDLCKGIIKKGEKYDRWVCVDGGEIEEIKVHEHCNGILSDCLDSDTEFDWRNVQDWVRDICIDNELCSKDTTLSEMAIQIANMSGIPKE